MKIRSEHHVLILQVLALIPEAKVATYGQVARLAGLPRHARLVGYILKHLDAQSDVPWHRVVNAQGKIMTTPSHVQGQNLQQLKLLAEGVVVNGDRVNLKTYQWQP